MTPAPAQAGIRPKTGSNPGPKSAWGGFFSLKTGSEMAVPVAVLAIIVALIAPMPALFCSIC